MFNWGRKLDDLESLSHKLVKQIATLEERIEAMEKQICFYDLRFRRLEKGQTANLFSPASEPKGRRRGSVPCSELRAVEWLMKAKYMDTEELAKKTGCHYESIGKILRGCESSVSLKLQKKIAMALGCTVEELRGGVNNG